MFMATLLTIAEGWSHLTCPTIGGQRRNSGRSHGRFPYSYGEDEVLPFATTAKSQGVMLNLCEGDKHWMSSLVCGIKKAGKRQGPGKMRIRL